MVKISFYSYLLTFYFSISFLYYFNVFHLNPRLLMVLQVFDFSQVRNLGVEFEQGYIFWVFFYTFVICTDPFRVFQEKL
jgi:hypothetical protein